MSATVPVLIINLATAGRRWNHIQADTQAHLPWCPLVRIDAVDWRSLPSDPSKLPVTLFTRYLISFPEQQSSVRISHRQVDTLSSVAIVMSHMKCWQWLIDHPKESCVLILEDDACFDRGFQQVWDHSVTHLLTATNHWDLLVLGYFAVSGTERVHTLPGTIPPVETKTVSQFYGAHAYMVTRNGAQTLLQHALPIDVQVDGLFLTLHELQELRLHMLMQSTMSQCMDSVNREGSWHTHTVITRPTVLTVLQGNTWPFLVYVIIAVLIGVVILYWRSSATITPSCVEGK
jgi:GR25 family glycosyltransferase involved in LPS biosynthesis